MTLAYDPSRDSVPADQCLDDVISAMGARVPFAKGAEIYSQGEVADLIYRIIRGSVRLTHFTRGRHHPIGILVSPGDLFGLDSGPEHLMTAEADTDCVILVVSRRGLAFVWGEAEFNELIELEPSGLEGESRPELTAAATMRDFLLN